MSYCSRKATRLPDYDYARQNYYFVTICTHNKECIFWQDNALNDHGKTAEECLQMIGNIYDGIYADKYVVMPNHIHAIIVIDNALKKGPSLTHIVGQYKMSVTKRIHKTDENKQIWQRSFHDHIIRNQADYERIWLYIHGNPQKWNEDCFYMAGDI